MLLKHGDLLETEKFNSITDEASKTLANIQQPNLFLPGLICLSDKSAEHLSRFQGTELDLSGLTSLSDRSAYYLSKYVGWLKLSNIKNLSHEALRSLGTHRGGLDLDSLESLSDLDAQVLSRCIGGLSLSGIGIHGEDLPGLRDLSDTAVGYLANHKGTLHLALKKISDRSAYLLGQHTGGCLILDALTEIGPDALCSLAKHIDPVELFDVPEEIKERFLDIQYKRKHTSKTEIQKIIYGLKSYMREWLELGISEELDFRFSGSGDEGCIEPYVSSKTTNLLKTKGYEFGWLDNTQHCTKCIHENLNNGQVKKGILEILLRLLPSGWEINYGTHGYISLNTILNKVIITYNREYENTESEYVNYKWNEEF